MVHSRFNPRRPTEGLKIQDCCVTDKFRFYRNVLVHVPKRSQSEVTKAMKAVFVKRDKKSAKAKAADMVRRFQNRFAKAIEIFEAGIDDGLSYLHYAAGH